MHIIPREQQLQYPNRTIRFEGEPYGAGVSFFLVDNEPGQGPGLHVHPYPETWIVRSGRAQMTAGEDTAEVSAGDIVVVPPNTPHKFQNLGPGRLDIVCIHAAGTMVQHDLED